MFAVHPKIDKVEEKPVKARVYFVRHGETDYNRDMRIQGQIDIPLNEAGRQQAKRVADRLAAEIVPGTLRLVVSSPLSRARETAAAIAQSYEERNSGEKVPLKQKQGFTELDFGELEGTYLDPNNTTPGNKERMDLCSQFFSKWNNDILDVAMPGGETPLAVRKRATDALMETLADLHETTVLADSSESSSSSVPPAVVIVAHGRLLRTLMAGLLHVCCKTISLGNTAVSRLDWIGDDRFVEGYLNSTTHAADIIQPSYGDALLERKRLEEEEKKKQQK